MSVRVIKAGEAMTVSALRLPGPGGIGPLAASAADPPRSSSLAAAPAKERKAGAVVGIAAKKTAPAPAPASPAAAEGPSAEEILQAARAEAARLVADAQARAAEIERTARDNGLSGARSEVRAEIDHAIADLRAQLTASLDEVAFLRADLTARAERDLVRLALEIAKKVVHREVRVDHEVALTLARVALGRLHSRANAVVRLHPDDYAHVSANRERLGGEATVEIIEDRSVGRGGCVVQSEMGEIDARIEQQFAEIEREFLSAA
ncbi:MAG: FliH/SctL family protein [Blastocatellia bacterium]|nr:FliH/SctL family protein [Blastocatellia bacterium]